MSSPSLGTDMLSAFRQQLHAESTARIHAEMCARQNWEDAEALRTEVAALSAQLQQMRVSALREDQAEKRGREDWQEGLAQVKAQLADLQVSRVKLGFEMKDVERLKKELDDTRFKVELGQAVLKSGMAKMMEETKVLHGEKELIKAEKARLALEKAKWEKQQARTEKKRVEIKESPKKPESRPGAWQARAEQLEKQVQALLGQIASGEAGSCGSPTSSSGLSQHDSVTTIDSILLTPSASSEITLEAELSRSALLSGKAPSRPSFARPGATVWDAVQPLIEMDQLQSPHHVSRARPRFDFSPVTAALAKPSCPPGFSPKSAPFQPHLAYIQALGRLHDALGLAKHALPVSKTLTTIRRQLLSHDTRLALGKLTQRMQRLRRDSNDQFAIEMIVIRCKEAEKAKAVLEATLLVNRARFLALDKVGL